MFYEGSRDRGREAEEAGEAGLGGRGFCGSDGGLARVTLEN